MIHFLWSLLFLKVFGNTDTSLSLAGGQDAKTFCKWVWQFIPAIASLQPQLQIKREDQLIDDRGADCLISVDGTDFRIPEQGRKFYSHKFKKSALRYEVALCIHSGNIIWINGPYEAGLWNDISIFRNGLKSLLGKDERVEADDGYVSEAPRYVKCPKSFLNPKELEPLQQRVRSRQDTVNKRFKQWGVLNQTFRHKDDIGSQGEWFAAIIVMTQAEINAGAKLFDVKCRDFEEYNF